MRKHRPCVDWDKAISRIARLTPFLALVFTVLHAMWQRSTC